MKWYEYKMEVDDLHASDDLKAKLLAMQAAQPQTAASAPAAPAIKAAPKRKKAVHFPGRRWGLLAACAVVCVVGVGAATFGGVKLDLGARSSGAANDTVMMAAAPRIASMQYDVDASVSDNGIESYASGAAYDSTGTDAVLTEGEATEASETGDSAKLIYTANLTVETRDYETSCDAIDTALAEAGGYLESSDGSSYTGQSRSLSLTMRIPQENYDSFLEAVATVGNLLNKSEQIEDVTSQYMDLEARLTNLESQRTRLQQLQASAETLADLLDIESKLSDVQYQIESWQSQLDWYSKQVACSTVYVTLQEVETYTPSDESFGGRVAEAFASGWSNCTDVAADIVVTLIAVWPVAVLMIAIAVVVYIVRRRAKKRA